MNYYTASIAVHAIIKTPVSPRKISGNEVGTFLNQGQQYKMELTCVSIHQNAALQIRTAIQLGIFDNKFNVDVDKKFDKWSVDHPGLDVIDIKSDGDDVNVTVQKMDANGSRWDVRWLSSNQVKLYLMANIIGTDFDEITHGCEGVIFSLKCESFCEFGILSDQNYCPQNSYISCIRLKVFKSKGGDRKLRDDIKKFQMKDEEYKRDIIEWQNINKEIENYKSQLPVLDTLHKENNLNNEIFDTDIEFIQTLGENYILNQNIFQTDQQINDNNNNLNENQMNLNLKLSENIINKEKESNLQLLEKDIEKDKIIINRDMENNIFYTDIAKESISNEINNEKKTSLYNLDKNNQFKSWTIENRKFINEQDAKKKKLQLQQEKIIGENQIEQMRIEALCICNQQQEKINSSKILRDMQNKEISLSENAKMVKSQLSLKLELFNREKQLEIKDYDEKSHNEKQKIFKDNEIEKEKLLNKQANILRESELQKEKMLQQSEIEKEKMLQQSEIEKEKMLQQSEIEKEKMLQQSEFYKKQMLQQSEIDKKQLLQQSEMKRKEMALQSEIDKAMQAINQKKMLRDFEMEVESNKQIKELNKQNEVRQKYLENEKIMNERKIILHKAQLETENNKKQREIIEKNVSDNARDISMINDLTTDLKYMEKRLEEEKIILQEQYENKEREIERQKIVNDMELKKLQEDCEAQAFQEQKNIEEESKQKLNELAANSSIELKEAEKFSLSKKSELEKKIHLRAAEIRMENQRLSNDAMNRKILADQQIQNQKFLDSQKYQSLKNENYETLRKGIKTIQDMKNNQPKGSQKNSNINNFKRQKQEALEKLKHLANESEYKKSLIKNKYEQLKNMFTSPCCFTILQQPSNDRDRQSLFNFEKNASYLPPSYESTLSNPIGNQAENQTVNQNADQIATQNIDQMNENSLQSQKRKSSFTSHIENTKVPKHESCTIPFETPTTISHLIRNMNPEDLTLWLQRNRFYQASKILVNFSGTELLNLSKEQLSEIIGNVDAIRLRNLLVETKNTNLTYIYVTLEDAFGQIYESVYRAISLRLFTINELIFAIQNNYPSFPRANIYNLYISNVNGDILGLDDSIIRQLAPDSKFNVKFSIDPNNPAAINVVFFLI